VFKNPAGDFADNPGRIHYHRYPRQIQLAVRFVF